MDKALIEKALKDAPKRTRNIMERRFGFHDGTPWSYKSLSAHYGMTIPEIKTVEAQALELIRPSLPKTAVAGRPKAEAAMRAQEAAKQEAAQ